MLMLDSTVSSVCSFLGCAMDASFQARGFRLSSVLMERGMMVRVDIDKPLSTGAYSTVLIT